MGLSYTYAYVYESNNASKSLFSKMGYSSVREIKTPVIPTYKKLDISPEYSIKPVDRKEIGDAVTFINEYDSGFIHFLPFKAQIFEEHLSCNNEKNKTAARNLEHICKIVRRGLAGFQSLLYRYQRHDSEGKKDNFHE